MIYSAGIWFGGEHSGVVARCVKLEHCIWAFCKQLGKMLSLKNKEGGVHVCDIVKGRAKPQPLYYYYDIDDALLMQVDDIEALLKSSLPGIKDKLRINQEVCPK